VKTSAPQFNQLKNVIVADRFMGTLPLVIRDYVRVKERDTWFPVDQAASLADTYANVHPNVLHNMNLNRTVAHTSTKDGEQYNVNKICINELDHILPIKKQSPKK